jgi:hypothetical protein
MALADDIEFYGRAVAAGDMPRAAAVKALTEASKGGLTETGAGTTIDNWQTARATYRQVMTSSARNLDRIYGFDE